MKTISFRLVVPASDARPTPPIGPILGQFQINLVKFCAEFNELSATKVLQGVLTNVRVFRLPNKTFTMIIKKPSFGILLEQKLSRKDRKNGLPIEVFFDLCRIDYEFSSAWKVSFVSHVMTLLSFLSVLKVRILL